MITQVKKRNITVLGMELVEWSNKSCVATVAEGDDWATIYSIKSSEKSKGHASELLNYLIGYYDGKNFGSTVALSPAMKHLLTKFKIKEYV